MTTSPPDEPTGPETGPETGAEAGAYVGPDPDPGARSATPAAAGLGLLSLGGWLLTTTRPWQKPGSPLTLTLDWTASGALMICGLVLLTRCVRLIHGTPGNSYETRHGATSVPPR